MDTQLQHIRLVVSLLIVLSSLLGLPRHSPAHVVEFMCAAGDVACLIDAINQANANGEANTITLEAGTYTLTAVDNKTDGPNGLPSVTSTLTIQGAGGDTTILEREPSAPRFRCVHVAAAGSLTLEGLTLRGGNILGGAEMGVGGAILNNGGRLTLVHVTLDQNRADLGGGLGNLNGTVAIAETLFTRNGVPFGGGGLVNGIAVEGLQGGVVLITTTTFADNGAGGAGGGLLNDPEGTVTITQTTFVRNGSFGGPGGGLANSGTAFLQNTTIAGNTSFNGGGGLSNDSGGTTMLTSSTVADNQALAGPAGGLLNQGGQLIVLNMILARNTTGNRPECVGMVTSLGTNLVGNPTGCTMTLLPTDLTGDPGLGDFTDDGTPGNGHFPLLAGRPAINAGTGAFCPPTDQLGQRRVGPCDIGAIEFRGKRHKHH